MSNGLTFFVPGIPRPKGSMRALPWGRVRPVITADNAKTAPWQRAIAVAAIRALVKLEESWPSAGPFEVRITFMLPRPKRGRPGVWHFNKPDLDKLARTVLDALTQAHVYDDDGQVARLEAWKCWVPDKPAQATPAALAERQGPGVWVGVAHLGVR